MASDPYQQWLDIPPGRRPPSPWDLLGLPEGETDEHKIREAGNQRYEHVRNYVLGPDADDAHRILGEISQALNLLLSRELQVSTPAETEHDGEATSQQAVKADRPADPEPETLQPTGEVPEQGVASTTAASQLEKNVTSGHRQTAVEVERALVSGQREAKWRTRVGLLNRIERWTGLAPATTVALGGLAILAFALAGWGLCRTGPIAAKSDVSAAPAAVNDPDKGNASDSHSETSDVNVSENTQTVTTIATAGENAETDPPSFQIQGGADAAHFTVDGTTGALSFESPPDYENPADADGDNVYEVEVSIVQADATTHVQAFRVTVGDENEPPTIAIDSDGEPFDVRVFEKATTVLTLTATDEDLPAQTLSYRIRGGADAAKFIVESATGTLAFLLPPEFEAPADMDSDNIYEVTLDVVDSQGARSSQTFRVTVTDAVELADDDDAAAAMQSEDDEGKELPDMSATASDGEQSGTQATPIPEDDEAADYAVEGNTIFTNSIGMNLVLIPAGEFRMGSPDSDPDAIRSETPQHAVRITKPFFLAETEVTQEQYHLVLGDYPSRYRENPKHPVEQVTWDEAVEFCRRLSAKEEKTYRIPTEAEWEYACRAGTETKWYFGDDPDALGDYAWYSENSASKTNPVAQKTPNAWGLYDMHGNVWEWCADGYEFGYYENSPVNDPVGPESASYRVRRGGSMGGNAKSCRAAFRGKLAPGQKDDSLGFRVALNAADVPKTRRSTLRDWPPITGPTGSELKLQLADDGPTEVTGMVDEAGKPVGFCSILYDEKLQRYLTWFNHRRDNNRTHAISCLSSHDGVHWDDPREVTFEGISYVGRYDSINTPVVLRTGGHYCMWVQEYNRGHAWTGWIVQFTSVDGIQWHDYRPILKTVANGSEDYELAPMAVLRTRTRYLLYYRARAESDRDPHIWRATSSDNMSFGNRASVISWPLWACEVVATWHVPAYVMFYTKDDDTLYSTSSDGTTWLEQGRFLDEARGLRHFHDPKSRNHYVYYRTDDTRWRRRITFGEVAEAREVSAESPEAAVGPLSNKSDAAVGNGPTDE